MSRVDAGPHAREIRIADLGLAPLRGEIAAVLARGVPAADGDGDGDGQGPLLVLGVAAQAPAWRQAAAEARAAGGRLCLALSWPATGLPAPFAPATTGVACAVLPADWAGEGGAAAALAALAGPLLAAADGLPVPLAEAAARLIAPLAALVAGCLPERAATGLLARAALFPDVYGESCGLGGVEALALLDTLERRRAALGSAPAFVWGGRGWNRAAVSAAFAGDGPAPRHCATLEEAVARARAAGGRVLAWAARVGAAEEAAARQAAVPLWRIEDGFLRSVGLGAGLARGAAYSYDPTGIHFDATRPSRMEALVLGRRLQPAERRRADALRAAICAAGLTKYNLAGAAPTVAQAAREAGSGLVLLVPGQVADDAGVRRSRSDWIACATTPNVNLDLLRAVRARNPQARILFKPHPDVEAGLRQGAVPEDALAALAAEPVRGVDLLQLLPLVDRVETFSSLAGFEALLRDVPVTVYGLPFYAGWGVSDDLTAEPRRTGGSDLATLVHVAYVDYPLCVDPLTLVPCPPEVLVRRLAALRRDPRHRLVQGLRERLSWLGRRLGL